MSMRKKLILIVFTLTVCGCLPVLSQKNNPYSSEIIIAGNATHIARITKDSILVAKGSTYSFTVDTPEDSGLVMTSTTAKYLLTQITSLDGSIQQYSISDKNRVKKSDDILSEGDRLMVISQNGKSRRTYHIGVESMALGGRLVLDRKERTVKTESDLTLYFTAGQRTPNATVKIFFPAGINLTADNTTVNVIGRGAVKLKDLATQSIGRVGGNYPYHKVGNYSISKTKDGGNLLLFKHLDLRPANGPDLVVVVKNVRMNKTGKYIFKANYTTAKPEVLTSAGTGSEIATLLVRNKIADFERVINKNLHYRETPDTYTQVSFKWSRIEGSSVIQLLQSIDKGNSWSLASAVIDSRKATAFVSGLKPDKLYSFKLSVKDGEHKGLSNTVFFFSGKMDIRSFGIVADGKVDNTDEINKAITYMNEIGGGTLLFSSGEYNVRTVHLKSNVYLYLSEGATIRAIKGADAPESTWFSDKKYRSGLSPTDTGPYADPENYLTKQDVGHHYFRNSMFFGERLDNVKIIGNGYITGNGNLVTGDNVMRNAPDNRADKMFTFKLCTNLEIGGISREEDLWYDSVKDEPYYILKDGSRDFNTNTMLQIDRGGHFVLLATGSDNINVHDTYFRKTTSN